MEYGNTFTTEYEISEIKDFEKKILALGVCKSFLPTGFISYEQKARLSCDGSGYQSLENYEIANSKELIGIVEKCVFALIQASSHLLNPRKFEVNTKTVFYSDVKKEIKFVYVPKKVRAEKATDVFVEFIESLNSSISKCANTVVDGTANQNEMKKYLKEIVICVESKNRSLFDIVNYLGEIKQEIHACQ